MPHDRTSGSGPHDVTMPQLGMAQDAGKIVSWLKAPGDAVAKGDALLEVETDKAVMEVEAQAGGYLTHVTAAEGDDVPVGQVIARISDSAEGDGPAPAKPAPDTDTGSGSDTGSEPALPKGHEITMPQLGMAQDTGLLVSWLKAPGDKVSADEVLFEVETDKSTMEVAAGRDGWLAATLAQAGEEVPVGHPVAILTAEKPDAPVARSVKDANAPATASPTPEPEPKPDPKTEPKPAPTAPARAAPSAAKAQAGGRILASPKARRLALEQGLDLARLAEAGHPQPYHVADLDTLRALPGAAPGRTGVASQRRLTAHCTAEGLQALLGWASDDSGLGDPAAILAGLAGASLGADAPVDVGVERFGQVQAFTVPPGRALSAVCPSDGTPALVLRDLRGTPLVSVAMGAEDVPVLTLTGDGAGLAITLECAADQFDAPAAIRLLTEFAGRVEQPLRHLL